jgi:hypothetical protein
VGEILTKHERIEEILRRLREAAPFSSLTEARAGLELIIRAVEDEFSGIPENPDSPISGTDGRIYPPHDRFEIETASPRVRTFKQLRHRTSFGENGALQITTAAGTVVLDLAGADGKSIAALLQEDGNELR